MRRDVELFSDGASVVAQRTYDRPGQMSLASGRPRIGSVDMADHELGAWIREVLAMDVKDEPVDDRGEHALRQLFRVAGAKSWRDFARRYKNAVVYEDEEGLHVVESDRSRGGAYMYRRGGLILVDPSDESLGAAARAALANSA
jgi:hypothetical protein